MRTVRHNALICGAAAGYNSARYKRCHDLLKALDKFIAKQDGSPSRPEAVRMILTDALISYGALPVEAPPPVKRDAN